MEYFEGVTLLQFFRRRYFNLAVDEVKLIIKQLLLAVEEMHRSTVAHRDIKLDNILVS
jgi:serine/threonine protein kinase